MQGWKSEKVTKRGRNVMPQYSDGLPFPTAYNYAIMWLERCRDGNPSKYDVVSLFGYYQSKVVTSPPFHLALANAEVRGVGVKQVTVGAGKKTPLHYPWPILSLTPCMRTTRRSKLHERAWVNHGIFPRRLCKFVPESWGLTVADHVSCGLLQGFNTGRNVKDPW